MLLCFDIFFAWQLAATGPGQGEGTWGDRVIQRWRGDRIHLTAMQILKEDETPTISTVLPSTQNLFHVWIYLTGAFFDNKFHLHLKSKILISCQFPTDILMPAYPCPTCAVLRTSFHPWGHQPYPSEAAAGLGSQHTSPGCKAVAHKVRKMILPLGLALQRLHLKYCIWFWILCTRKTSVNWSESKVGITKWGDSWNMWHKWKGRQNEKTEFAPPEEVES